MPEPTKMPFKLYMLPMLIPKVLLKNSVIIPDLPNSMIHEYTPIKRSLIAHNKLTTNKVFAPF